MPDDLGFTVMMIALVINSVLFVVPDFGGSKLLDTGIFEFLDPKLDQFYDAGIEETPDSQANNLFSNFISQLQYAEIALKIIQSGFDLFNILLFMFAGYTSALMIAGVPFEIIFIIGAPISYIQARYIFTTLGDIGQAIPRVTG